MATERLPGRKVEAPLLHNDFLGVRANVREATRVDAARGSGQGVPVAGLSDDQVVQITLEDGIVLWQSVEACREDFGGLAAARSGDIQFLVPPALTFRSADRGVGTWIVKALQVLDVDLGGDPIGAAAGHIVEKLEQRFESRLKHGPGLYAWQENGDLVASEPKPGNGDGKQPRMLLFIHGTASCTEGGFGLFRQQPAWKDLRAHYNDQVFAFEHRSLSQNPIQNALDLAKALPVGATLDLVSHSRGGLVGELLARAGRVEQGRPASRLFDDTDKAIFQRQRAGMELSADSEVAALEELGNLLQTKRISVSKFVRVGCPARGTTLASRRLDRYLSVTANLMRLVPGLSANPAYELVMALVLAVAKKRTDPKQVPGLEAQMPESPLIAVLNRPDIELASHLGVISGDVEGGDLFGKLKVLLTDLYYRADHDLVVNTDAMYGGARRVNGFYLFDQGAAVNHFRYFANNRTAEALSSALLRDDLAGSGFSPLAEAVDKRDHSQIRGSRGGSAPVVYVLPGIMGSTLSVGSGAASEPIWLRLLRIAKGDLDKIAWGAAGVEPGAPFGRYYGDLIDMLAETHEVIPFAYDWRMPLSALGERLARSVSETAKRTSAPIRFLGHSMGGLVVRAMGAADPELWKRVMDRGGSRFMMVGTPNGGSPAIVAALLGRDQLIRRLASLDFTRSNSELIAFVAKFPGVLALLPRGAGQYYSSTGWAALDGIIDKSCVPALEALGAADADWAKIETFPLDPQRTVYVAGFSSKPTPVEIRIEAGEAKVLGTWQGDGRVPWLSGIPGGVTAWYVEAAHGDLCRERSVFAGYRDLLETGTTDKLLRTPPAPAREALRGAVVITPDEPDIYPSEDDLMDAAVGAEKKVVKTQAIQPARVQVAYGNLRYASHVVVVGHYEGDVLAGPEALLNRLCQGKMERMRALGLYPGGRETAETVFNDEQRPAGALVMGLGRFGELTPGALKRCFSYAARKYALQREQQQTLDEAGPMSLSTLIIGHRESKLTLGQSLVALLEGVKEANEALGESRRIQRLQIVELYEDTALEAVSVLNDLSHDTELSKAFQISPFLKSIQGGKRRLRRTPEDAWMRRLQVRTQRTGEGTSLVFTSFDDDARATEVLDVAGSTAVQSFLDQVQADTATRLDLSKVLFEILVPPEFKPYSADERGIFLLLDQESAAYPWELLYDRKDPSAEPLVVRFPCIRSLVDSPASKLATGVASRTALVVGDTLLSPESGFAELPGAQNEAKVVAELLEQAEYDVKPVLIRQPGDVVLGAILLRDVQIMHLAAHGVFAHGEAQSTGMVLGDNMFLTPDLVRKIRSMPELVFLNCCHLGSTQAVSNEKRKAWLDRHRIASNLAVQFIKSGAKAVIAAGWAVNDAAASLFAKEFYKAMLNGLAFAEAIHIARAATYRAYRDYNTWGAYQAYGDPQYRLRQTEQQMRSRPPRYGSVEEVIVHAANDAASYSSATVQDMERQRKYLRDFVGTVRLEWIEEPRLQEKLGMCYAALDLQEDAIACYRKAVVGMDGSVSVKTIEQLHLLLTKQAVQAWRDASSDKKAEAAKEAAKVIKSAIAQYKSLTKLTGIATNERWSLLGGAFKRLALVTSPKGRLGYLAEAANCYREAHELALKSKGPGPQSTYYPGLNWQLLKLLSKQGLDNEVIDASRRNAAEVDLADPTFWSLSAEIDAYVITAIALKDKEEDLDARILSVFRTAWLRGGSLQHYRAVREQLEFVTGIVAGERSSLDKVLQKVAEAIRAHVYGEAAGRKT